MTESATLSRPAFKRVKTVTQQVLTLRAGASRFFYFRSPMYAGKKIDDSKGAATLVDVVDMETGEYGVHVVSTIEKRELAETYPGDSYVNRGFEIAITRVKETAAGNKCNIVSISEVSVPDEILGSIKSLPPSPGMAEAGVSAEPAKKVNAKR